MKIRRRGRRNPRGFSGLASMKCFHEKDQEKEEDREKE